LVAEDHDGDEGFEATSVQAVRQPYEPTVPESQNLFIIIPSPCSCGAAAELNQLPEDLVP
jgi:hypothetical protein